MPEKLLVTRPTKIELLRLKRRLTLATRVQKIVKDRLSILIMEFLQTVRESAEVKERLLQEFAQVYRALSITAGYHGYVSLEKELLVSEADLKVNTGARNVAGVRIPLFEMEHPDDTKLRPYALTDTSSLLDHTAELSQKCLETIIELAELQRALELLGLEINKSKRITNALEYILIPGLEITIKYLAMKFEERDREEASRLKRVKTIIEHREAYAY